MDFTLDKLLINARIGCLLIPAQKTPEVGFCYRAMAGAMMGLMFTVALVVMSSCTEGQLTNFFYEESCPELFAIVKAEVQKAVSVEKRMAASLVRLHFHDCFVQVKTKLSIHVNHLVIPGDCADYYDNISDDVHV